MNWAAYGAVVSTAAFILGCFNLWLIRARWKRDQMDRQPELSWSRRLMTEIPPWEMVTITLRNRVNATIKAERARVIWPPKARIVGAGAAKHAENEEEPWNPGPLIPPDKHFRAMPLRLEVAQAGAAVKREHGGWPVMGSGDSHSTDLLVIGAENSRLILWISFSSLDRSLSVKSRMIVT